MASLLGGPTLGERLVETSFRPSGFDYLRISLASAVVLLHIPELNYGAAGRALEYGHPWQVTLARTVLLLFFALSGFLVSGSLERCRTLSAFAGLRMIRIFPALMVEVALSALVLGPIVSNFHLVDYLRGPEFRRYFLNIVGEIHFTLPGVFLGAPDENAVNRQLWTIPYELLCYLSLSAVVILGLKKHRIAIPILIGLSMIVFLVRTYATRHHGGTASYSGNVDYTHGLYLVWSFLCGVSFYFYRDRVRFNLLTFVLALSIGLLCIYIGGPLHIVTPIAISLVAVLIGLTDFKRNFIIRSADYSYGIYLYHWVILQATIHYFSANWLISVFIGLPLVVIFAAFSWHLVEKPAMRLRRPLMAADANGAGSALIITTAVAAAMIGFVACYQLYPLFNPLVGQPADKAKPATSNATVQDTINSRGS